MKLKTRGNRGETEAARVAMLKRLQNPGPALQEIGAALVKSTQRRIRETKESPAGVPWAPWKLSTLLGRNKKGNAGNGLLFDGGNLFNNITFSVTGKQVQVGVNAAAVPYATFLQTGTPDMPARPFIGISKTDQDVIGSILRRHVTRGR